MITYIAIGIILGPILGFSLMFTAAVSYGGSDYIVGYDDEKFLYKKRPWFNPFSLEVVHWTILKEWKKERVHGLMKFVWERILMLTIWIFFWPVMAVWAFISWIVFATKMLKKS